ncbi:MAG: cell division protein ZipA, partial [Oceanospirillaceae bacterium]|nr:cell division protein ZipA [Oceanospirillaceae bacterium]
TTDDVMSDAYQDSQTQEQTEASSPVGSSQDTNETYQTSEVEDPEHIEDPHLDQEVESMPEEPVISQPVNYAGANAEVLANRPDPELVLVIHTIAREEGGFNGSDLLFLFNSCDLRYGEKDIFHRFEEADGEGRIQFSVAQVRNPGTFDPSHMADQSFMGLSFFMSLPGAKRPLEAYEAMSEMAMVVSRNLNADVLDESHSAMTTQTMEHERQQILEYERQQRLAAKKRV